MAAIVKEAVEAGALGFSTSRTLAHRAMDGEPVPGTFAAEDELFGIGRTLGEVGRGVFELAPAAIDGLDATDPYKEIDWMTRLGAEIHRPVSFALLQLDPAPDLWRELMDDSLKAVDAGADLRPQVASPPVRAAVRPPDQPRLPEAADVHGPRRPAPGRAGRSR